MTANEIKAYYANLLIMQYLKKPKAYATVAAQVYPALIPTEDGTTTLPLKAQDSFNIETAIGIQLDVLGKYVGVSRTIYYYGVPIVLNDSDFRSLIKFAVILNSSDSSLYNIQKLLVQYFGSNILIYDYQNMYMSYFINSSVGTVNLIKAIISQFILPKPMGVQLATTIYAPVINKFFGFRTYSLPGVNNNPLNSYTDYKMDRPFLSYANAV